MFGLLRPKCPLDVREQAWTEAAFDRLCHLLGTDYLLDGEQVQPESQKAQWLYEPALSVEEIAAILAHLMRMPISGIEFEVHSIDAPGDAVGMYTADPPTISVCESILHDRNMLLITLARELACHHLHLAEPEMAHEPDFDLLADLLPTLAGMGILSANCVIHETNFSDGILYTWSISRRGNLPARMLAYAMALQCWLQGETDVPWIGHLRRDASATLSASLRYLNSAQSLWLSDNGLAQIEQAPPAQLMDWLHNADPVDKMHILWHLQTSPRLQASDLTFLLKDRDPILRAETATTLRHLAGFDASVETKMLETMNRWSVSFDERLAIVDTLGERAIDKDRVLQCISRFFDIGPQEAFCAVVGLARLGTASASELTKLQHYLTRAVLDSNERGIAWAFHTLLQLGVDPADAVENLADEDDRHAARAFLEHLAPHIPHIPEQDRRTHFSLRSHPSKYKSTNGGEPLDTL